MRYRFDIILHDPRIIEDWDRSTFHDYPLFRHKYHELIHNFDYLEPFIRVLFVFHPIIEYYPLSSLIGNSHHIVCYGDVPNSNLVHTQKYKAIVFIDVSQSEKDTYLKRMYG